MENFCCGSFDITVDEHSILARCLEIFLLRKKIAIDYSEILLISTSEFEKKNMTLAHER